MKLDPVTIEVTRRAEADWDMARAEDKRFKLRAARMDRRARKDKARAEIDIAQVIAAAKRKGVL